MITGEITDRADKTVTGELKDGQTSSIVCQLSNIADVRQGPEPLEQAMADDNKPDSPAFAQGFIVDENGKEIPITDKMVTDAMKKIKLQSIGAHTGFTKAITDEMLEKYQS